MKKKTFVIIVLFGVISINSFASDYMFDMEELKKMHHLKKWEQDNNYVKSLTAEELLEFAYELVLYDETSFEESSMILVKQVKKKFSRNSHEKILLALLRNNKYKFKFRYFILEIADKYITESNNYHSQLQDILLVIAKDDESNDWLRRFAILKIDVNKNVLNQLEQLKSTTDKAIVKSVLITKLSNTSSGNKLEEARKILSEHKKNDVRVVKSTVLSMKKEMLLKLLSDIQKVAKETEYDEVFNAIQTKLIRQNHPECIVAYIKICKRLDDNPSMFSWSQRMKRIIMAKSIETITEMLNINQPYHYQKYALTAIRYGQLMFDSEIVKDLLGSTTNDDIAAECRLTLEFLAGQ